jgi:hypothetical protein
MIQPTMMTTFTPNQSAIDLPDAEIQTDPSTQKYCSLVQVGNKQVRQAPPFDANSLHPPLSLDSINNPRRRPKVIVLKIDQELNNLITLGRICNQWSPDEDGVAYCHRQRYGLGRAFACAAYNTGVVEKLFLVIDVK